MIVAAGVVMLLAALPARVWAHAGAGTLGVVSRVTGERRFDVRPSRLGVWAAPLMGMAFAFAWTPCIGPVLGVVLGLAAHNGTLPGGVLLLFAYSLGLAVPFVLVGLAFGRLTAALTRARHWLWAVELVAGRPRRLRRAAADRQRQLGVDAVLEPPQRPRPQPPLEELGRGRRPGRPVSAAGARGSLRRRADAARGVRPRARRELTLIPLGQHLGQGPGERVGIAGPARRDVGAVAHDPGRARVVGVSRARPLVLRRQSGEPFSTSAKSAGSARARVTSCCTDMSPSVVPAPPRRCGSSRVPEPRLARDAPGPAFQPHVSAVVRRPYSTERPVTGSTARAATRTPWQIAPTGLPARNASTAICCTSGLSR